MEIPFPLEFLVEGIPASAQSTAAGRERWKGKVSEAARSRLREVTEAYIYDPRPLAVTILFFAATVMQGDVDNIVKPILDAMVGAAYPDDGVIERVVVQRFEPRTPVVIGATSPQLRRALEADPPVVYVRVEADLAWRRIP